MSSSKQKKFRLARLLAGEFEKVCTILGIHEQDAMDQAIRAWLKKNRLQTSIETWMKDDKRPIVFQHQTMIKMQVNIVKNELKEALDAYQECEPRYKLEWLKNIQKIYPTAQTLVNETRDLELQELIKQVEALSNDS